MSKNTQRNIAEVNLGNETYSRGFNDGLNNRPITIKKTHRHVHRYHAGYSKGQQEHKTTMKSALAVEQISGVQTRVYTKPEPQSKGLLSRIRAWFASS